MKVSIFTPTHDSSFLREIYESIREQDFYEWIIVYNGGAQEFNFGDPRVKSFILESSTDFVGSLKNFACSKATGDILLELDHDDLLLPGAIEEVKNAFLDESVGFVYSNTVYATGDFRAWQTYSESYGWKYRDYDYYGTILKEHVAFPPTPEAVSRIWYAPNHLRAFRKSVYEQVGGYNTNMRVLDDQDLMSRLYQVTKFHHIDKPLYLYRVTGGNTWLKHNDEIQNNVMRIYDHYIVDILKGSQGLKIDLGGRFNSLDGFKTVDLKDADYVTNLDQSWPFDDSSVSVIRAYDIFEHLKNPIHVMKECYRVLKPGGWIIGQVPSTDGRGAFQDPTHVSFWNENSFLYYTHTDWAKYIDTPVRFQAVRLYTTEKNDQGVSWVVFNLISLKDYRPCGEINI